jgi:hypothetical protein
MVAVMVGVMVAVMVGVTAVVMVGTAAVTPISMVVVVVVDILAAVILPAPIISEGMADEASIRSEPPRSVPVMCALR